MNFPEQQEPRDGGWTNGGALNHPRAPPLKVLQRAQTLDETRLYRKRIAPSTANGSFGGLSRKIIQRQNSTPVNFPLSSSSSASSAVSKRRRLSTVVAAQKVLAAKKRRQELLERPVSKTAGRSWSTRIKVFATVCVATLLILAGSSLLFISLLIVDPILVGLNAQFRNQPGICRTEIAKNVTGPLKCEMPSCREGCTADLYVCTFLFVTYQEAIDLNFSMVQSYYNQEIPDWDPDEAWAGFLPLTRANESNHTYHYDTNSGQNVTATLMINPNGCGYPPEVNCSDFYDRFSSLGTLFPCFYSDSFSNEGFGVVVPFYDRSLEMKNLGLYGGVSLGTVAVLFLFLILLTKIKIPPKVRPSDLHPDMENQSDGTLLPFNSTVDDSAWLIDKDSRVDDQCLEEMSERRNGHGPKKNGPLTPAPSSMSLLTLSTEKTDMAIIRTIDEVQVASTSRNLP